MNKTILTEMFTKLYLASIDVKALRENLYNLLEHKHKSDTPSDILFQVASSCIEYEKPLKNVPISGLMLYKDNVQLSYLVHTQSKNVDTDLVKSGLDLDSIDINKVSDICAELIAINKVLIARLCDDIATYIENDRCVYNGMSLSSRKFISDFLKFVVDSYTRSDYFEVFKLRYKGGVTGFELFLIDLIFESAEDNLKLFKTNRAMVESIRGV
jgi:hypothetical protein